MHDVRAVAAEDHIVAVAAVDGAVACTAQEDVIARAAVDYVGVGTPPPRIVAGAAGHGQAAAGDEGAVDRQLFVVLPVLVTAPHSPPPQHRTSCLKGKSESGSGL